jgi:signal peptidase I
MKQLYSWVKFPLILFAIGFGSYFVTSSIGRAVSNSMYPTISQGDFNVINRFDRNPKKGDIITYECFSKCSYKFLMHRVVDMNDDHCYLIKGDNNDFIDSNDWLCQGKDMKITGTVYPLNFINKILAYQK